MVTVLTLVNSPEFPGNSCTFDLRKNLSKFALGFTEGCLSFIVIFLNNPKLPCAKYLEIRIESPGQLVPLPAWRKCLGRSWMH
jgi:hypothetical protein